MKSQAAARWFVDMDRVCKTATCSTWKKKLGFLLCFELQAMTTLLQVSKFNSRSELRETWCLPWYFCFQRLFKKTLESVHRSSVPDPAVHSSTALTVALLDDCNSYRAENANFTQTLTGTPNIPLPFFDHNYDWDIQTGHKNHVFLWYLWCTSKQAM